MSRLLTRMIIIAALLMAAPLAVRADDALSPAQKQAVEQVIRDYFKQHPEFLIEVLRDAQEKLKEEKEVASRQVIGAKKDELLADAAAPVAGNPKGDVTIVEFFDYRCPYCKQVEPSLAALLKEDPKIRLVYKEFPVLGPESTFATRMALAARKQGKYFAFHDAMMAVKGHIDNDVITKTAASVGVDVEKAKTDMKAPDIDAAIKRNYALADALNIEGTPAFIIGDVLVPGATDIETLKKLVASARKSS